MYSSRKCDFHLPLISMSTKHLVHINPSICQDFIQEKVLIRWTRRWSPPHQLVVGITVWACCANEDRSCGTVHIFPEVECTTRERIVLWNDSRPETLPKYASWLFSAPSEEALCGGRDYISDCLIIDLSWAEHVVAGYLRYVGNGIHDVIWLVGKPSNDRRAEPISRIHGDLIMCLVTCTTGGNRTGGLPRWVIGSKCDHEDPVGDESELWFQHAILTARRSTVLVKMLMLTMLTSCGHGGGGLTVTTQNSRLQ